MKMKTNLYIKTAHKLYIPNYADKDFPYNYSVIVTSDDVKVHWAGNSCNKILSLDDLDYFTNAYAKYLLKLHKHTI